MMMKLYFNKAKKIVFYFCLLYWQCPMLIDKLFVEFKKTLTLYVGKCDEWKQAWGKTEEISLNWRLVFWPWCRNGHFLYRSEQFGGLMWPEDFLPTQSDQESQGPALILCTGERRTDFTEQSRAEQNRQQGEGEHCFKLCPGSARCPSIKFMWENRGLNIVFGVWSGKDMLGFVWPHFQVADWDVTGLGLAMVSALDSGASELTGMGKGTENVLLGKMWPSSGVLLPSLADWELCSGPLEKSTFDEIYMWQQALNCLWKSKTFHSKAAKKRKSGDRVLCGLTTLVGYSWVRGALQSRSSQPPANSKPRPVLPRSLQCDWLTGWWQWGHLSLRMAVAFLQRPARTGRLREMRDGVGGQCGCGEP